MSRKFVICASASFYEEVIKFSYKIDALDIDAVLPETAQKMKSDGSKNIEAKIDWSKVKINKASLIRGHFEKIKKGDAILVMNYEKYGKANYIGPNVLMEMAVAFSLDKPIYVLNGMPKDSPFVDEILGLEPIFLNGDTTTLEVE